MPFKWALQTRPQTTSYKALTFYGPYMVVDTNKGELGAAPGAASVQCTLQLHVQFKGQR